MRKNALSIEKFRVRENAVDARILVREDALYVDDALAQQVFVLFPTIKEHSCADRGMGVFAQKIWRTETPHLVEHVAIDLLVRAYEDEGIRFAGHSSWLDRARRIMRVSVSYVDMEVTRAALEEAVMLVSDLIDGNRKAGAGESDHEDIAHDDGFFPHPLPAPQAILQILRELRPL